MGLILQVQNPRPPSFEQTASILSFVTYGYLDSTIYKAYHAPHLPYDELPVLADYEHADHLAKTAFPYLDPAQNTGKPRHIFFGLLRVYCKRPYFCILQRLVFTSVTVWEWSSFLLLIVLKSFLAMLSPFAMNHLLVYLESGSKASIVRPWVWIMALFVGPMSETIVNELYLLINTRIIVITEAIMTQLVFERALKMRFTDESEESSKPTDSGPSILVHTPSEGSIDHSSTEREGRTDRSEGEETVISLDGAEGPADTKGKSKAADAPGPTASKPSGPPVAPAESPKKTSNLVGRLTNMVSTDLANITDGGYIQNR